MEKIFCDGQVSIIEGVLYYGFMKYHNTTHQECYYELIVQLCMKMRWMATKTTRYMLAI